MPPKHLQQRLLASYHESGGINHVGGGLLPSQQAVDSLAGDFMRLLFPGYFEGEVLAPDELETWLHTLLARVADKLTTEIERSLRLGPEPAGSPRKIARETAYAWFDALPGIRSVLQGDVQAALEGDPAARHTEEIILAYPCVVAIALQRTAHVGYGLGVPLLPRMLTEYAHRQTGIDIHPGATLGPDFFIDHGTGVVIGETARIGARVKLYQGVTLGAKSFARDSAGRIVKGMQRHPLIEDDVTIYAGATILGGGTRIGAGSIIGSNVWLMESVPPGSVVMFEDGRLAIRPRRPRDECEGHAQSPRRTAAGA